MDFSYPEDPENTVTVSQGETLKSCRDKLTETFDAREKRDLVNHILDLMEEQVTDRFLCYSVVPEAQDGPCGSRTIQQHQRFRFIKSTLEGLLGSGMSDDALVLELLDEFLAGNKVCRDCAWRLEEISTFE